MVDRIRPRVYDFWNCLWVLGLNSARKGQLKKEVGRPGDILEKFIASPGNLKFNL